MAGDRHSAEVQKSWSAAYDRCYRLYDDDKLEECIVLAERHLKHDSMPPYHRMLFYGQPLMQSSRSCIN